MAGKERGIVSGVAVKTWFPGAATRKLNMDGTMAQEAGHG